jgi:hypothetical protein
MSKQAYRLRIDVSKIDKSALYKGQKGTYLDAVIWLNPDEPDQYGQVGSCQQDLGKDRREAGEKGAYIGNLKPLGAAKQAAPAAKPRATEPSSDDDIPF